MQRSRLAAAVLTPLALVLLSACDPVDPTGVAGGPSETSTDRPAPSDNASNGPTPVSASPTAQVNGVPPVSTPPDLPYPKGAPTTPSDPAPSNVVAGRIVAVGAGPCYTVETDDQKRHALFGGSEENLTVGTTVRVVIEPAPSALVSCAGKPGVILHLEIVGTHPR